MTAAVEEPGRGVTVLPNYGIDADRVLAVDDLWDAVRRRFDGRYAIDEFGGDPHLMDLTARLPLPIRVHVEQADHLPRRGPALLVANRGIGLVEPMVLSRGVRQAAERRLRVVGAPDLPIIGPALNKLGAVGYRPDDVAAILRAGHLAAAPLGDTWFRSGSMAGARLGVPSPEESAPAPWSRGVGAPPRELLAVTMGFPVIPVAIVPGGPFGLPVRPWRVTIGTPLLPPPGTDPHDLLAAAELGDEVRRAVGHLLEHEG